MSRAVIAAFAAALLLAPAASAAQVSYVDGGEVWISTLDGSSKRSLSGPSPDDRPYQEAVQSDDGHVLGVRRIAGQQGQLNSTVLWAPDGSQAGTGTLTMKPGYSVNAYPVTLDLTPDGRTVVYGYSLSRFNGQYEFSFGTMGMNSSGQFTQGIDIPVENGTLAGTRVIGRDDDTVRVQRADGVFSPDFDDWIGSGGPDVFRTDVAATGTAVGLELGSQPVDRQIALGPVAGVGGAFDDPKSCYLDTEGDASGLSFSPDGTSIAWTDARGVVVAGAPVWFDSAALSICVLSRPAVVLSATGKMPSIGASTAASPPAPPATGGGAQTPSGGAGTTSPSATTPGTTPGTGGGAATARPAATVAKVVKASALRKGVPITVRVARAGTVTVTGRVGKRTVGRTRATAKRAGTVKLRLKASRKVRKRLRALRGKTLVLTVEAPGGTTTVRRKLG